MENKIENGKIDVMGINIDISQVLGQKIIDQYIAQLSEENVQAIIDYVTEDLFTKTYDGKLIVKTEKKDGYGYTRTDETSIGNIIKKQFNKRIEEELVKKVEDIIASTDYQNKIDEIANELIDYSIEGYKNDMKERIRERLVGNVMDASPSYGSINLVALIRNIVHEEFQSRY